MAFTGRIGHLKIESPFGNAGGVVKTEADVIKMASTGVGWVEAGSYTAERRLGNGWNPDTEKFDRVVYYHDPKTGITTNSLGMQNKGMFTRTPGTVDSVADDISYMVEHAADHGKPLVVNVAPVDDDPVEESYVLVDTAFARGADAVLLNAGCPNVVKDGGERHELLSRDPEALAAVLAGLEGIVKKNEKIFLRVSPLRSLGLDAVAQVVKDSGVVSAVFTPNTWPGHVPTNSDGSPILGVAGGAGGASGPFYSEKALVETSMWVHELRGSGIDVVRSSGIMTGEELRRGLGVGAVAGAGTTFFYESQRGWQQDVHELLSDC